MLITKQPKKSNNNIRYSLGNNPQINSQVAGKVVKKNRPIKQKLHKNLSQLPCGLLNDSKQNASLSNLMIARPHSSLVGSDISRSLSRQKERVNLNSFGKEMIKLKKIDSKRNTLSIVDVPMKTRKVMLASNSNKKWSNKSVEEDPNMLKFMMAQNRKKYNLSCGDMIQSKSKMKENTQKLVKKKSMIPPKTSKNQSKKLIAKQPENQTKKFKQIFLGNKSKGSTSVINPNQAAPKAKKKQKQNKQNKKKHQRSKSKSKSKNKSKKNSKSNKMFVLLKGDSDQQNSVDPEYPTNKYVDMRKKAKKHLNIKVGLDYNFSCLNLGSNSSGIINQEYSSSIEQNRSKLQSYSEYEASNSINIEEIKYYEERSPLKNRNSTKFDKHKNMRNQIYSQLEQQYPYLNSTELNFLSSIVLIQRKWREVLLYRRLNQRRRIVTQYLQQPQNSREYKQKTKNEKISSQKHRFGQKTELSRTKIAEFQPQQQTKQQNQTQTQTQTQIKMKLGQLDLSDFERKNSMKNQVIIYSNQISSESKIPISSEHEKEFDAQAATDRKPKTQKNTITLNYAWIISRQVFPEVSYLQYRRNHLRQFFQKTMKSISDQKLCKKISEQQFEYKKKNILTSYEKQLEQLKKTKHDIKKGYLKYIDCINKIKELKSLNDPVNRTNNKYGIRKVSSESNFLSTLYEKIFKFDTCLSEWSGSSQSVQMLTKKILIRKQFFRDDKKSSRKSLSDVRSAARSSFQMIKSSRDNENNTLIIFEQTDRYINLHNSGPSQQHEFQNNSNLIKQFKFSSQIFKSKSDRQQKLYQDPHQECQQHSKAGQIPASKKEKENLDSLKNSVSLIAYSEEVVSKIQSEIILELAKELQKDIHRINPVLMDIILINQPSLSEFQEVEIGQQEQDYDFKSPAMNTIQRELQTIGSPRNLVTMSSEMQPTQIMDYIFCLVTFINKKKWGAEILYNMNNNQTFQPLTYLKFLRDFQIPQNQYIPIINNEKFIEWETFYNNQNLKDNAIKQNYLEVQILRQSQAIFHRCVFQVFLAELEKNRPYGQKGRPFPWEQKFSSITIRQIADEQLSQVIQKSINKIEQYLVYKCGLITQKVFITNEEQLERAHQQNEDRIIDMLEQDLAESSHQWYEVEEHLLEIKLELSYIIEDYLFEEIIRLDTQWRQ